MSGLSAKIYIQLSPIEIRGWLRVSSSSPPRKATSRLPSPAALPPWFFLRTLPLSPSRVVPLSWEPSSLFSWTFWCPLRWFPLEECGSRSFSGRANRRRVTFCSFDESGPVCSDLPNGLNKGNFLVGSSGRFGRFVCKRVFWISSAVFFFLISVTLVSVVPYLSLGSAR